MPIQKTIVLGTYGVPVSFHKITNYSVDEAQQSCSVTILQYFDEVACQQGRMPLASEHIYIHGVPADGAVAKDWIEQRLVESEPGEGGDPSAAPNRYVLAGGTIVSSNVA